MRTTVQTLRALAIILLVMQACPAPADTFHRISVVEGERSIDIEKRIAAPLMAEALRQLEQNLSTPLATNDGIDRYYALAKEAGERMPDCTMKSNYPLRQHMQKAALDKCIQLRLRRQSALEHDIKERRLRAYGSFL